jgi:hypothetical protein
MYSIASYHLLVMNSFVNIAIGRACAGPLWYLVLLTCSNLSLSPKSFVYPFHRTHLTVLLMRKYVTDFCASSRPVRNVREVTEGVSLFLQ